MRCISTHAPAGGATNYVACFGTGLKLFLLTPLREGRPCHALISASRARFLLTPLREGRPRHARRRNRRQHFYSRPCGRGDIAYLRKHSGGGISTHAPAGGATCMDGENRLGRNDFYSRPCGRGDEKAALMEIAKANFFSRPCGRGDRFYWMKLKESFIFLLTPLREGRRIELPSYGARGKFLLTPLREGRPEGLGQGFDREIFLLTPLREGRPISAPASGPVYGISTHAPAGGATRLRISSGPPGRNFYSRPCGRGDCPGRRAALLQSISTHAPAGGATFLPPCYAGAGSISTHAPAGGATPQRDHRRHLHRNFYSRPCGRGDSNFPQVRHEVLRQIAER